MKLPNTIILGLGTGRCGTTFLGDFLNKQPEMALCTHEHLKWKWNQEQIDINAFIKYNNFKNSIVGDVGSFLLPHVIKISEFFKETKIIILKRNKNETIKSWMRWTNKLHNYWVPHTKGVWKDDPWDVMFPKFDVENQPKEVAIEIYYDYYYQECKKLDSLFKTLWIKTEDLSRRKTKEEICFFCGFDLSKCNFDVQCNKNSNKQNTQLLENMHKTYKTKILRKLHIDKKIEKMKKIVVQRNKRV